MIDAAHDYAQAVVDKKIVAGLYVRAACERHLKDLTHGHARGLNYDPAAAARVISYFETHLRVLKDGALAPFTLEPAQKFLVGSIFGWKNANGKRRFRSAYIEMGKGGGKSPLAAGIGHYMLAPDKEHSAEVYVAASKKDQAEIIFRDAVTMWRNSPSIKRKIGAKGVNPVRRLFHIPSSSFFEPISADSGGSGPRPHCALVDELHEHTNGDVLRILMAGQKGRTQPLTFMITNSGTDRKSICWDMHVYATEIATGVKEDDGFFSYVCALDEGDDPLEDPSCWIKANPLLGVTIHNDYLEKQVREAKAIPANMNLVKRLNFCQWTDSVTQAISRETWMKCQGNIDVDDLTARNVPCYGGLDLSRARDLTAFTLTWLVDPTPDKWRFATKTWFFTPKDTIKERTMRDRAPYDVWVDQGHIEPVPGPRISYHWMARRLAELISKYAPLGIAADEYGLERLREAAQESGVDLPEMLIHPQGFQKKTLWKNETNSDSDSDTEIGLWMPNSILQMENALMEQRITVDESPVMNLCAASVVYEENRIGQKMYAKDKAANRIDGIVALAMSIGRATLPQSTSGKRNIWDILAAQAGNV